MTVLNEKLFQENVDTKFKNHVLQIQNVLNIFIYQKHIFSSVYSVIKGMICWDCANYGHCQSCRRTDEMLQAEPQKVTGKIFGQAWYFYLFSMIS